MNVKPMLTYRERLFGSSVNNNSQLAKSFLAFMVVCLYGGPKLLVKTLPVSKLDAYFLYKQSELSINPIKGNGGLIISINYL